METTLYLYPWDLLDEGAEKMCERALNAGLSGFSLAASYHAGRFLEPHSLTRKVRFVDGGSIYFQPDLSLYTRTKLRPHVDELAQRLDPLQLLLDAVQALPLEVTAWTVCGHDYRLASQHPEACQHTAFGDPMFTDLCPANPDVREYFKALASDISRYPVRTIQLEWLHYSAFEHGFHHEATFLPPSVETRFLLSLCFCAYCTGFATSQGVDVRAVRQWVQDRLNEVFAHGEPLCEPPIHDRAAWDALVGGEMGGFLAARCQVVSTLLAEVREAVRAVSTVPVVFQDTSPVYMADQSPSVEHGWRLGVAPSVYREADGINVVAYRKTNEMTELEIQAAARFLPEGKRLEVSLAVLWPWCNSAEDLAQRVEACERLGVHCVGFYNYGTMLLERLDWIRSAIAPRGKT